ncbi:hypothetical protein CRUP_034860 [Coryphaenoides rupestris]|nr:hypothetical protein CRUP_034860 [Coryphaenoides rupestris]
MWHVSGNPSGNLPSRCKISFNESGLYSTYEYPSEGSRLGQRWLRTSPEGVGGLSSSMAADQPNLSNYIPKHSVDFNAWQEHKMEEPVPVRDANAQQAQTSEEVMLTPADSTSLSDYSSEPALYF